MSEQAQTEQATLTWETWGTRIPKALRIGNQVVWIQALTKAEYDEVRSIQAPPAPIDYKTDVNGKYILKDGRPELEPKPDDSEYRKQLEETELLRSLKILEFGLVTPSGKDIPGESSQEKIDFLKKGTAGYLDKIGVEILRLSSLLPGDVDFLLPS